MDCKIFIRRNFGHGYKDAWPELSFFQRHVYLKLVRNLQEGVTRKFGFWVCRFDVPDNDCSDPGAANRHPVVDVRIVFPWGLKGNPSSLDGWRDFVGKSRGVALGVHHAGFQETLTIEIPDTWKGGSEW